MITNIPEERCSCNARLKHKCCKESTLGGGKMCVKELKEEVVPIPVELIDRIKSVRERAVTLFANLVDEDREVDTSTHQVGKFLTAEQLGTTKYSGTEHLDIHTLKTVYNMMKSDEDKQWIGFLIANKLKH